MSSTSEVGHAKNVAHFGDLIAYCTAYGATYNPPKPALQIISLNTLLTSSRAELDNVITAKNALALEEVYILMKEETQKF